MIIGRCFATPFTEDINCYHAHKIISETAVEQIGVAESLIHIITLPSNHEIITQIDNDEIIIDDTAYNAAKKLAEYLLSQAKVTICNIKPIKKTSSEKGNCFRHGNEIGMITGQVRDGRKIGFSGLRLKDDKTLNSFLLFVNPEELLSNAYEQIDPDVYHHDDIAAHADRIVRDAAVVLQIKGAVAGYGRADKGQVIRMVTSFLGLKEPPKPDDTADALAAAICHSYTGTSRLAEYYNRPTTMAGKIGEEGKGSRAVWASKLNGGNAELLAKVEKIEERRRAEEEAQTRRTPQ